MAHEELVQILGPKTRMVWFGMSWSGLRQRPSESSVKVSSRSNLFWLFWRRFSVGLVWSDLRQCQAEGSIKVSSRSDLFWLV